MTTIHVTINDHAEALGVVATLLNQGYTISIDMDVVAEQNETLESLINQATALRLAADEVAVRERLWGKKSKAQRNIELREREEQQARYDARIIEVDRSLNFECPKCGVTFGQPCVMSSGKPYTNWAHVDRIGLWYDSANDRTNGHG